MKITTTSGILSKWVTLTQTMKVLQKRKRKRVLKKENANVNEQDEQLFSIYIVLLRTYKYVLNIY